MVEYLSLAREATENVGLAALIVLLSSEVRRSAILNAAWTNAASAIVLAAGVVIAMAQPIQIQPGIFIDARSVLIGLASFLLGASGAVLTVAAAVVSRYAMGGAGMVPGIVGILVAALAALALRIFLRDRAADLRTRHLLALGCAVNLSVFSIVLLPLPFALKLLGDAVPPVVASNFLGCLVFGFLLRREHGRVESERRNQAAALTDPLTGLANRRAFDERLAQLFAQSREKGAGPLSALALDLDRFKAINDGFGHAAGDVILRSVAEVLREELRGRDLAARLGGDEFFVLLPATRKRDAAIVARRVFDAVARLRGGPEGVTVSVSIGIASTEQPMGSPDELVAAADAALYRSKAAGRARVVEYGRAA